MAIADTATATMLEHAVYILALTWIAGMMTVGFALWGWGRQQRRASRAEKRLAVERRRSAYLKERLDETKADLADARWRLDDEQAWLEAQRAWTPRAWAAFGPVKVNGDSPGAEL